MFLSGEDTMRHSLAFDPAARYSGAALLDPEGALVKYWTLDAGALDKDCPQTNLRKMRMWADEICLFVSGGFDMWVTVENLSHYMSNPAPALRMQGVLLDRLDAHDQLAQLVLPAVWQNALGWKKTPGSKETSKSWAKWMVRSLGFDIAPTPGSKAAEDAGDAVLLAYWRQAKESGAVT